MNAAPIPKDTQDFQFKHACTQQVCDKLDNIPFACSLIVADGKRGLLYIGHKTKLTVQKYSGDPDFRCTIDYDLPQTISKLSISCDFSFLGITFNKSTAYIYNANLLSKNTLEVLHEVQLSSSSPNVFGYDLRWNPAAPGMFCTVASDHTIGCFQINVEQKTTTRLVALEKIVGLEAMCVAWSPKGKQLVVGCKNGNIVQLKPELKVARTIPGPSPAIGEVIGILWISNYQFCAAYSNINERRINVLIVNAPKGETVANFICYEDITYGMPDMEGEYLPRYYFDHVPEWNLIIAASSSSSEVAVLGSLDNGANWEQWQLIDSARAQLPLIRTTETYPVGMTIDKSSIIKLPWGPENTLPDPVPMLHILGTSGLIISFHMVNLQPNCPAICSPPSEPVTIMPQSRMSMLPSEISFNNHSGITSTPRPKLAEAIIEKPKPLPNVNLFNNPPAMSNIISTAAMAPPAPSAIQTIASTPAPVAHVDLKIPKPRSEKIEVPQIQKTEQTRLSPVKEISVTTPASENANFDDSICWRAYQEELTHFEKELRSKLEPQVWQVGTEEERQKLIAQYAEIDEFWRELRETTNSLSSEIAYLKALLLQSFAWVEETKSRNSVNGSDAPRDRHDRSKIQELQRLATHTQTQLIQAMKAIDMQWSECQSQERSKMKIPSLEFIYQALKKQSEIVARHKKIVDKQMTKIRALSKGNKMSNLNRSIANLSLNSSTMGGLFGLSVNGGIIETRCRTIANNIKNFTRGKQLKLRGILLHNVPSVIKPIVPTPVQDRLEATLSSLATLNPVTTPSKQKVEKLVPDRPAATKASQMIINTTTTVTPTQKNITSHNPLASLTNIVANIGSSGLETATPSLVSSQLQSQSKLQPAPFSMGTLSSIFANNTSTGEKNNTSGTTQLSLQSNMSNQLPIVPAPSSTTSTTQSSVIATAFPKVMSISFGTPDQKTTESTTPVNTTTKETPQKSINSSKPVDRSNTVQSAQPLFDTNLFASSMSMGSSSTVKNDMFSGTSQGQISTGLGSGLALSFKDSLPQVTSSQQSVFSFASPSSTTAVPKTAANTTNNAPSDTIQTFSFVSNPFNTSAAVSPTKTEPVAPVKSAIRANLELSKMTTALPSFDLAEKPSPTVTSTTSFASSFGHLSTPISSTINFGKALSLTPDVAQPQQEHKTSITLPAGTSIEKVGVIANTATSTTSGSSIFGGNAASPTNTFGTSIFGGTSMSSALPQAVPLSTADKTPVVSSTASIFSTPASSLFSTTGTLPWNTGTLPPAPPAYNDSQFRNILGDLNVRFGQPSQPAEVSTIFDKTPAIPPVSSSVIAPSSPFAQTSSSPLSVTNLVKSPSTTTASTEFFTNNANTSNNSIFGGMTNTAAAPAKLFGGNVTSPAAASSIFGGGVAAAAPASSSGATPSSSIFGGSIFGGSSTFGAQPSMPAAAPASVFGASPAFAAKPTFGGQPPMFGAAKPEFNSPFGSSGFGSPAGFGGAPSMPASPPAFGNTQMSKVFGSPTGSSTFESLAGQSNQLGFDSLAQKSPSPEKPQTFSGGSSFSSWR